MNDTYTEGLGENVRAARVYMGLGQRAMADALKMDRRDYQRIENGRDACPPGFIHRVEELLEQFDSQVDILVDLTNRNGPVTLSVRPGTEYEWERSVAGQAAVLVDDWAITLTLVG